ncbi:MAG: GNAT family N-acetyltransferase [Phycisphaerae bacterium]
MNQPPAISPPDTAGDTTNALHSTYHHPSFWNAVLPAYDDGELHVFHEAGITIPLIVRSIPRDVRDSSPVYENLRDVISPYDFAGPLANDKQPNDGWSAFLAYARRQGWLTAFFRFHPLQTNIQAWSSLPALDVVPQGRHVVVELGSADTEGLLTRFKPQVRRDLKVAERAGVQCDLIPLDIEGVGKFHELYTKTMVRREAPSFFHFPVSFFENLAGLNTSDAVRVWLLRADLQGELVSASILLIDGSTAFYFLTGFDYAYRQARPMNAMVYHACRMLPDLNVKQLYLGGGPTGVSDFKSRFATTMVPFYIGRAVFDHETYDHLCLQYPTSSYFPAYRDPTHATAET